jgi:hypothetical protein
VILHKPSQLFQFFGRNNLSARCQLGSIGTSAHVYVETVAMADRLSKNFGKLVLAGLGNRNGDDEEHEDESAQTARKARRANLMVVSRSLVQWPPTTLCWT